MTCFVAEASRAGAHGRWPSPRLASLRVAAGAALLAATAAASFAEDASAPWIGTWAAVPQAAFPGGVERYRDLTLRLVVHTTVGGARVRIRLSKEQGA